MRDIQAVWSRLVHSHGTRLAKLILSKCLLLSARVQACDGESRVVVTASRGRADQAVEQHEAILTSGVQAKHVKPAGSDVVCNTCHAVSTWETIQPDSGSQFHFHRMACLCLATMIGSSGVTG